MANKLDVRVLKGVRPGAGDPPGQGSATGGQPVVAMEYAAHLQFEVDGRNIIQCCAVAPGRPRSEPRSACRPWVGAVERRCRADSAPGRKLRLRRTLVCRAPGGRSRSSYWIYCATRGHRTPAHHSPDAGECVRRETARNSRRGRGLLPRSASGGACRRSFRGAEDAFDDFGQLRLPITALR